MSLIHRFFEETSYDRTGDWRSHPELGEEDEEDSTSSEEDDSSLKTAGGQGSGNFGHSGRPGEQGGSSSADSERTALERFISVNAYVHGNFRPINEVLRQGTAPSDELSAHIKNLDAIIAENPTPAAATVFRVIRTRFVDRLKPGDVFVDKGYVSTSANKDALQSIRGDLGYTGLAQLTHLQIEVPAGTGHIDVNTAMKGSEYGNQYRHQQEMILPRGTRFLVKAKTGDELHLQVVKE